MTEQQLQIDNDEISLKELIQKIKEWVAYLKTQRKVIFGIAAIGAVIGFTMLVFKNQFTKQQLLLFWKKIKAAVVA